MKKFYLFLMVSGILPFCVDYARAAVPDASGISSLPDAAMADAISKLSGKYPSEKSRIEAGVKQAARLWQKEDGDSKVFLDFCLSNFYPAGEVLEGFFSRIEYKLEQINGHINTLELAMKKELDEDTGAPHPADAMFASYRPSAHVSDDLFKTKIAFAVLLNYPVKSLEELLAEGPGLTRKQWAQARLAGRFAHRVPAEIRSIIDNAEVAAESYVNSYNIFMDSVAGPDGKPLFKKGLKLISHWGLRDELKLYYNEPGGFEKQKVIFSIMNRIISQEIPGGAVNSGEYLWDPVKNTLDGKPAEREPDTRYAHLLDNFRARLKEDPYYPDLPTNIDRQFKLWREIPEEQAEKLFVELVEAGEGKVVAALIKKRLGRELQPFDIWYDGFRPKEKISIEELNKITAQKYPDALAFQKDIPEILKKLGFDADTAVFLADRIQVDAARGAGHAAGAEMRTEKARLRTRVSAGGMDYQGFNTSMHELGHTVEQVFSLYKMDHTLLQGVPNSAFTEGFAFVFQDKDMDMLGMGKRDEKADVLKTLNDFWAAREIAGVALVDMRVWHWMYGHPGANAGELREAAVKIAEEVWNKYYAPVFGVRDSGILAVYSHMIYYGLYLPNYPLGHIIAFQVEDYFKTHSLAAEMERMCRIGSVTPFEWMRQAVGGPISTQPFIKAAAEAVKKI